MKHDIDFTPALSGVGSLIDLVNQQPLVAIAWSLVFLCLRVSLRSTR